MSLKRLALPDEVFLSRLLNRHITSIDAEPILRGGGREVIMGDTRVPDDEIAGFSADFDPFTAFIRQPFHALLGESKPFVRPGGDLFFVGKFLVELVAETIRASADDQTAIIWSVREEVDEAAELVRLKRQEHTLGGNGSQVW
jgi:hypothetical protein